jgi:hypothetical protein
VSAGSPHIAAATVRVDGGAPRGLECAEVERTETVRDGALILRLALPLPSVSLVEIEPAALSAAARSA